MDLNMARDTSEKRAVEAEHLPCPRCDSTNTKFCYYNNYNFSQPRHFCKACRRYWTHGGTLRDIPVGGATRKNAKRCRTSSSFGPAYHHLPTAASQLLVGAVPFVSEGKISGSFTSLLSSDPAAGFVSLGGFGVGVDDVGFGFGFGFGLGRESWPFSAVVDGGAAAVNGGDSSVAGQPWQLEGGGNGHYFAFPDLSISTPRSIFNK